MSGALDTRRATREELDEIEALLGSSGLPGLPAEVSLSNVLVALEDGVVVGVVSLEVAGRRALTAGAAVSPEHQGKGVGASLVRSLVSRAYELGLRELYAVPLDAADFWDELGFAPVPLDEVPYPIKAMQTFPAEWDDSTRILCLELETRF
jgi:N-acetylglutamate synthase-like GNAT family acetyltransferase